jgi:glycosyltransferase involved in cell wall biosynthesis
MVPVFLTLAAPLAKARRVPLLLWYTHWHAGRALHVATGLADAVLSVDRRSFPLETPKARGIGHAIDVDRFRPRQGDRTPGPLRLLALGRTARWKGYGTMLDALEAAPALDAQLEIRGPQLTDDERAHRTELEARIAGSEALRERVRLEPPVPRDEIPGLLAAADALVSATEPRGSETLDKVVFEAAACGVPVVASNTALDELLAGLPLRLRFAARDAADLAAVLREVDAAGAATRAAAGRELRRRVVEQHSVDHWADAVLAVAREEGPRRRS